MSCADVLAEDETWPVCGTITSMSDDGRRVSLNCTSSMFHVGMFIVPEAYDPERNYDDATVLGVADIDGNTLHLTAAVDRSIVGSKFFTVPRVTPDDPSQFNRMDLINVLHALHRELRSDEFVTSREHRLRVLCISGEDNGSPEAMLTAYKAIVGHMSIVQEKCSQHKLYNCEGHVAETCTRMLNEIRTIQNRLFEAEYAERALLRVAASGIAGSGSDEKYTSMWNFSLVDEEKKSDYTELLEYFLRAFWQHSLRHKGQLVYERITTIVDSWRPMADNPICADCEEPACFAPDVSMARIRCSKHRAPGDVDCRLVEEDGVMRMHEDERKSSVEPTQAWTPKIEHGSTVDIRTMMHRFVDQHSQTALFNKFISYYSKGVATCVSYMSTANNPLFPAYAPDPKKFSFQNGVYDIKDNRFYEYGSGTVPDCCCVNHVEEYFDTAWTEVPLEELPVPGYDHIVASQDYNAEMRMWLDVFLGRLFFAVGEFDSWEKFLVIKGWAATGKSTIAKALLKIFGPSNVGNIPANCEEQWALASVHDKRVWLCTELKKDWRFPTAVLQSMISGEVVPVHVKNQTAVDIQWRIQGAAFGNEEPTSWQNDTQKAMFRRTLPFPFDISPKTQDPTVQKKFMKNTGRFLVRLVRSYLQMAMVTVGERSIDDMLPERLKDSRTEFLRRTQPLIRFLEETRDIILAPADIRKLIQSWDGPRTAAAASSVASIPDVHQIMDLKNDWRMRMSEVAGRFKDWWIENNLGKTVPSINSKSVYGVATTHLQLSVERDDAEKQDYLYGVKAVTTMRSSGYQNVAFGYTGAGAM
jgi:hypothetical protein